MSTAEKFNYTTGSVELPTVGEVSYNGVTFGPLFETKVSAKIVQDDAKRTTKFIEYTITVDGYVTLQEKGPPSSTIAPAMQTLRNLLTVHGGALIYRGRGLDLSVNVGDNFVFGGLARPGQPTRTTLPGQLPKISRRGQDVAWGPVPELIEFQPMGAGRSAKVQWRVTTRIPEVDPKGAPLLQLSYETTVGYDEAGFASMSISGVMEIPMTRSKAGDRTVPTTVDSYRDILDKSVLRGIDLNKFRVVQREFKFSSDKRTLHFDFRAEEIPYMENSIWCNVAAGNYTVRPTKMGAGLESWLCTLRVTYTVRNDRIRRIAWFSFLDLLRLRMRQGDRRDLPLPNLTGPQAPKRRSFIDRLVRDIPLVGERISDVAAAVGRLFKSDKEPSPSLEAAYKNRRVWLIDFNIDEGIHLNSKTITFSATWRLLSSFQYILLASGIWTRLGGRDEKGDRYWSLSMRDVSGSHSWVPAKLDPRLDVIVDFGGPDAFR